MINKNSMCIILIFDLSILGFFSGLDVTLNFFTRAYS
jgi:hypothetical protein